MSDKLRKKIEERIRELDKEAKKLRPHSTGHIAHHFAIFELKKLLEDE